MIEFIVFSVLLSAEPKVIEGALFNEYDYIYVIEARKRSRKGQRGRRRGGSGLR